LLGVATLPLIGEHADVNTSTDGPGDAPDRDTDPAADPPATPAADPPAAPPTPGPGADRRLFLRQLSADAVVTAGKLAGASAILRRSLVAAGEATVEHFETATGASRPSVDRIEVVDPPQPDANDVAATRTSTLAAPANIAPPDPIASLTAEQHAFLTNGTRAALAVNDPAGHPLVAFTMFHWDGALIRLPGRDGTARTANVDRDPRVSVLVGDPASEAWVAIGGLATLVYGDQVEPDIRLVLAKYHDDAEATRRWGQMRSTGDQLVIHVRPTRFVWRGG
jgi:hypothetical protein